MSLQRKTLAEMLTFTRAGTATYFGSDGLLKTAAANEPRFDYDPVTLQPRGVLVEGSRTNLLLDNVFGTMPALGVLASGTDIGGGEVFPLAGITATLVATGSAGVGAQYADIRFQGTGTGNTLLTFSRGVHIAATLGQNYSLSTFVAIVGGTLSNVTLSLTINEYDGATYKTGSASAFTPTATATRRSHTRLTTDPAINTIRALISMATTGAVDFTLRVYLPQLEVGAFATSVIPTTTAAVTRAADSVVMTGAQFSDWFNQSEGTFVVEFNPITNGLTNTGANDFEYVYDVDSSGAPTSNHILAVSAAYGPGVRAQTELAGVNQAALTSATTLGTSASLRQSFAYKANDFAGSFNGAAVLTDTSGTLPTPNRMSIGSQNGGTSGHFDGHIRRIRYWPNRLSNALLQEATA